MPLAQPTQGRLLSASERRRVGRSLRKLVARGDQAKWEAPPDRQDPIDVLMDANRDRIAELTPIRNHRMRADMFSFYRGSPMLMAMDLAHTPASGLWVQAGGDCHPGNFGIVASPEGTALFDLNDFDETLPAPFEWDVKRLAAGFAVSAHARDLPHDAGRSLARASVSSYRRHMLALATLDPLTVWRSRVDAAHAVEEVDDDKYRRKATEALKTAIKAEIGGYRKLIERRQDRWRFKTIGGKLLPLSGRDDNTHEVAARSAFTAYALSLPEEQLALFNRYRLDDVAFKIVGVGSIGRFCAVGLFVTPDGATLLLQVKEAQPSVLEPFAGPSEYRNHGQRVVVGQRMMQSHGDVFLGWTQTSRDDQNCYIRRFKDARLAAVGDDLALRATEHHAHLCGMALARAHARSGDAARIAGYMGRGNAFDDAIAAFAVAYAKQVDEDWLRFKQAVAAGVLIADAA